MKEWLNSSCKITVRTNDNLLFYTVRQVLSVTDSHITFIDKFNNVFTFHRHYIEEIQPLTQEK